MSGQLYGIVDLKLHVTWFESMKIFYDAGHDWRWHVEGFGASLNQESCQPMIESKYKTDVYTIPLATLNKNWIYENHDMLPI